MRTQPEEVGARGDLAEPPVFVDKLLTAAVAGRFCLKVNSGSVSCVWRADV